MLRNILTVLLLKIFLIYLRFLFSKIILKYLTKFLSIEVICSNPLIILLPSGFLFI